MFSDSCIFMQVTLYIPAPENQNIIFYCRPMSHYFYGCGEFVDVVSLTDVFCCVKWLIQQTRNANPLLIQRWPTVYDAGPAFTQHWFNVSCLMCSQREDSPIKIDLGQSLME